MDIAKVIDSIDHNFLCFGFGKSLKPGFWKNFINGDR